MVARWTRSSSCTCWWGSWGCWSTRCCSPSSRHSGSHRSIRASTRHSIRSTRPSWRAWVLTTVGLFVVNNEFTFWEQRYRGWRTLGALALYSLMTLVGTLVHVAVFSWLQEAGFLFSFVGDGAARVVHNLMGATIALVVNWYLNTTFVWRRRLT
ncbi:MAG: hypothetical protein M5U19_05215 [Microthrixaceae bacterium]|nr:hypothetical protein [Microthrixaceae bacterium]